ncbi:MAG TPA: nicotinate-nucleotide--dimethylbenzimidazole phosphoribosyltransferase [Anaerolineae bacterium]|nr:nicotinate-nucleotide--dimethylbenzimidazole phosphoribosyltransferase [Anaerolineae bacterium]
MITFTIKPVDQSLAVALQAKIDNKTKPVGALGELERMGMQVGLIQGTLNPRLEKPTLVLVAGDHGLVAEGVSAYPQEVTYQMVYNFLAGGAAANVLARQNGIEVVVVDAGVNYDFGEIEGLVGVKIGYGTKNAAEGAAMSLQQLEAALVAGARIVADLAAEGCNVVGFGEMGIGNTSAAALVMSFLMGVPVGECVGRGTGVDDEGLRRKVAVLERVKRLHDERGVGLSEGEPGAWEVLAAVGGFEMVVMVGGMLAAAQAGMVILVDGFIATAAFLAAATAYPAIKGYGIFAHVSNEQAHGRMVEYLGGRPLLDLGMRLGEGSGVLAAYPLVASGVAILNEMASFGEAGVAEREGGG